MRASGCLLHDFLRSFDTLHLRHGDIHKHDIGTGAFVFGHCHHAVAGLARQLPPKGLDNPSQVFACEYGIVHDKIANRLPVLTASNWRELLHVSSYIFPNSRADSDFSCSRRHP